MYLSIQKNTIMIYLVIIKNITMHICSQKLGHEHI